ncbi:hypothetical protein EDD86DRAFT_203052 [Gorgonomyces haynaldii]|nr:hypothetical protein EDD86DRAFT_203052 [Gorgonomyces haynaldii]
MQVPTGDLLGLPDEIAPQKQLEQNKDFISDEDILLDKEQSVDPFDLKRIQQDVVQTGFQMESDNYSIAESRNSVNSKMSKESSQISPVSLKSPEKKMSPLSEQGTTAQLSDSTKSRLQPIPAEIDPIHFKLPTRKWIDKKSFMPLPTQDRIQDAFQKLFHGNATSKPQRKILTIEESLQFPDPYQQLVMARSWRALAQLVRNDLIATHPMHTDTIMRLWWLRWWALLRLSMFDVIQLEAEKLGVFEEVMLYEQHSDLFPGRTGPMISLELWIFCCLIPSFKGNHHESIHRLYQLLYTKPGAVSYRLDRLQRMRVLFQITNILLSMDDIMTAALLLEQLVDQFTGDAELWSCLGRLYLQLGEVQKAAQLFHKVECILGVAEPDAIPFANPLPSECPKPELLMSQRAFISLAKGQFTESIQTLTQLLSVNASDATIMNNLAVAQLHNGNVSQAANFLESMVIDFPIKVGTCEPFLFNLASMYDLMDKSNDKKRRIVKVIGKCVGDDFDPECLKL